MWMFAQPWEGRRQSFSFRGKSIHVSVRGSMGAPGSWSPVRLFSPPSYWRPSYIGFFCLWVAVWVVSIMSASQWIHFWGLALRDRCKKQTPPSWRLCLVPGGQGCHHPLWLVLQSSIRVLDAWVSWNACQEEDLPDSLRHSADKVSQAPAVPGARRRAWIRLDCWV